MKLTLKLEYRGDLIIQRIQSELCFIKGNYEELPEITIIYSDDYDETEIICETSTFEFYYEDFPKNLRKYGRNKIVLKLGDGDFSEMFQIKISEIDAKYFYGYNLDTGDLEYNCEIPRLEKIYPDIDCF